MDQNTTPYWELVATEIRNLKIQIEDSGWTPDLDMHTAALYWKKGSIIVYATPFFEDSYDGCPVDVDYWGSGHNEVRFSTVLPLKKYDNPKDTALAFEVLIQDYLRNVSQVFNLDGEQT